MAMFQSYEIVPIDFEFCKVAEEKVELVCCSFKYKETIYEYWLYKNDEEKNKLKEFLLSIKDEVVLFSWAAVAEGRSFYSLGLNPCDFRWVDGFFEYRCLTNHNDKLLWGKQLVNGRETVVRKPPPKWERTEEDSANAFRPTHSLAEATYKLTGKIRDTEHKNKMRDLIISAPEEFTQEEMFQVMQYCTEDVIFLPEIFDRIFEEYYELNIELDKELEDEMLLRGKYAALTALMESWGYPINVEKTRAFSDSVAAILEECQREINQLFPEIKPFKWDKKERKFKWDQKRTKDWLKVNVDVSKWMKTDSYKIAKKRAQENETEFDESKYLSLSLDAWTRVFDYKHDYPKEVFGAQMVRYLKLKKELYGFTESNKTGSFWDAVGSDGRVRPYTNPYGAQSSRSQQSSKSFLFLKPAWMRSLCEPPPGKAICGIDYGSEEFLISALLAKAKVSPDEITTSQIEAYRSGDVYMAFAIAAGMAPEGATKATHKFERDLCKATVLGLSYLMSKWGLAAKLTQDTGRKYTEDEAQQFIDLFYSVYTELKEYQTILQREYAEEGFIKLPCGWYHWGDNDNFRSVTNVPVQGFGASILRKAVEMCVERGLRPIITLHDALYIEYDHDDYAAIDTFHDIMKEAFMFYFDDKENASLIKLDPFAWSPNYEKDSEFTTPEGRVIPCSDLYIDERAVKEYEQFSVYFNKREEDLL